MSENPENPDAISDFGQAVPGGRRPAGTTDGNAPPLSAALARRQAAWTRYWATGALHSCMGSFDGNYGGEIRAWWEQHFAALAPSARVLDIATGNGPLPRLLVECRPNESELSVDAIDLADISPPWMTELGPHWRRRVRFHGGTAAESLPFGDTSFDLVCSQFGIEYGKLESALPQAARVLRPGGVIACVLHHAESVTVRLGREEIGHLGWLLAPGGLLEAGYRLLEPMTRAATAAGRASLALDREANAARDHFNALQDQTEQRLARSLCPDPLHDVRGALAQWLSRCGQDPLESLQAGLLRYRSMLEDATTRLVELVACAMDDAAIEGLLRTLALQGVDATAQPLRQGEHLLGWALAGKKKGPLRAPELA